MVLLTVKKAEEPLFVHSAPTATPVANVVAAVVALNNMRCRVQRLVSAAQDLLAHGVMKPAAEHGYSEEELQQHAREGRVAAVEELVTVDGHEYIKRPDPTGRRRGLALVPEKAEIVQKTLDAALSSVDTASNAPLSMDAMADAIAGVKGAFMIVYPMGLPDFEPVRMELDGDEELEGQEKTRVFDLKTTCLWWASKELAPEKTLADYVGKNEKTKIVVKVQKKGQGAPSREPPIDEKTQKEMMAYYYRKQEEHKKLEANDDDEFVNSPWANPKALKQAFTGMGSVSWKPGRF